MKPIHVEKTHEHSIGISEHYFTPQESEILEDYMTHAVDALTVSKEYHLEKQLENTEEQHSRDYQDIRQMYKRLKEEAIETRKQLNNMLHSRVLKAFQGRLVDINANEEELLLEYEERKRKVLRDNNYRVPENPHVGL